tara:strand:+ start:367 stop:600 length:234 start_codon:yes stop_codon:yes gene_type:complete
MFLEFPRYSRLDIKQKSKKIEKTVLLIKKPVETLLLLKLLKLKISTFPLKYKKVAIRADKKPTIDKNKYNLFLCLSW